MNKAERMILNITSESDVDELDQLIEQLWRVTYITHTADSVTVILEHDLEQKTGSIYIPPRKKLVFK